MDGSSNDIPVRGIAVPSNHDLDLVMALRDRDERAFADLVQLYHGSLLRYARAQMRDAAVAEELVQETWLALLQGIDRFEGRSTLKTWLFHVLTHKINERLRQEGRLPTTPYPDEPAIDPARFRRGNDRWPGHWLSPPADWTDLPDERLDEVELLAQIRRLIDDLPPRQRMVLVLRDIEGMDSGSACAVLGVSDGSLRVLLHRARSRIREGLETYLHGESNP